jgi:hypothetical protein
MNKSEKPLSDEQRCNLNKLCDDPEGTMLEKFEDWWHKAELINIDHPRSEMDKYIALESWKSCFHWLCDDW